MKHKHSGVMASLATLLFIGPLQAGIAQAADVQVNLGSSERVTRLFAYPNNCGVICYRDWTLEQTAEHYLKQSLERDGYADATVKVSRTNDTLSATFSGVPVNYGTPLTNLLNAGDPAFDGASKLNGDGKWQYSWYFFLPLGMALDNRKSVELLHFPPDYSLTQAQDYLESKTTDRWASLLTEIAADREWSYGGTDSGLPDHHRHRPNRCTGQRRRRPGGGLRLLHRLPEDHGRPTHLRRWHAPTLGRLRRTGT